MSDDWIDDLNDHLTGKDSDYPVESQRQDGVVMGDWQGYIQDGYFHPIKMTDEAISQRQEAINKSYREQMADHNAKIAANSKPIPNIPYDKRWDGQGGFATSIERNGYTTQQTAQIIDTTSLFGGALGCALLSVCGVAVIGLLLWMSTYL